MSEAYRIGGGSGFWGDIVDPAIEPIEQAARVAREQRLDGTRAATIAGKHLTDCLDEIRANGWALAADVGLGKDRVRVCGLRGGSRPETLEMQIDTRTGASQRAEPSPHGPTRSSKRIDARSSSGDGSGTLASRRRRSSSASRRRSWPMRMRDAAHLDAFDVVVDGASGDGATTIPRWDRTGEAMCAVLSRTAPGAAST